MSAPLDPRAGTGQLSLPLQLPAGSRADDFIVGDANARAFQHLEHWGTWPVMAALLVGPRKSGRSLLARMFVAKTGGSMADDAERRDEAELFHAWNRAQAERRPLLIVADAAPPDWSIRLPDLRSRIAATPLLRIDEPDEALAATLLQYWFDRRQLVAGAGLFEWILRRYERSYPGLLGVVERLEEDAMIRSNARVTIANARAALGTARRA